MYSFGSSRVNHFGPSPFQSKRPSANRGPKSHEGVHPPFATMLAIAVSQVELLLGVRTFRGTPSHRIALVFSYVTPTSETFLSE
jgi:hypothetical protein